MKVSKNYQKIISQLKSLYAHVSDMAMEDNSESIWKEDMEALQEAIDIIYDYEKATEQAKEKTDNQIRKWLQNPESDSAKYKMWGNGIALPCAVYVMQNIAKHYREEE